MEYRQTRVLGGRGGGPDRFTASLRAVGVDRQDRLYAAGDAQVKVFDPGGRLLSVISTAKPAASVAVAPDGAIWVGESAQVEVFSPAGRLQRTWRPQGWLGDVTSLAFLGSDVLAADAVGRAIRRYDSAGKPLNEIGKNNRTNGFLIPNGHLKIAVDARGVIHAAHPGKHRVERYTAAGELLGHIGRFDGNDPEGFTGCCNPIGLALGPNGEVFVTEKAPPRAKVLSPEGKLLAVLGTTVFDSACKHLDIAVDSRLRVYVADSVKLQIVVFEPGKERKP
jgi:sugar lactone lactonase YvrE